MRPLLHHDLFDALALEEALNLSFHLQKCLLCLVQRARIVRLCELEGLVEVPQRDLILINTPEGLASQIMGTEIIRCIVQQRCETGDAIFKSSLSDQA